MANKIETPKVPHGTKFDTEKPRFELIPPDAELWLARCLTHGAKKYDDNNWTGLNVSRVIGALKRHLNAIERGEDMDDGEGGSGLPHHSNLLCNAVFLSHLLENYPDQDDRHFKNLNSKPANGKKTVKRPVRKKKN